MLWGRLNAAGSAVLQVTEATDAKMKVFEVDNTEGDKLLQVHYKFSTVSSPQVYQLVSYLWFKISAHRTSIVAWS